MKQIGRAFRYRHELNDKNQLLRLIFFHDESLKLLQEYSSTIILDCTYKTNHFNMPLLNIVGLLPNNNSFVIGQAFIHSESNEDFVFVIDTLIDLYQELGLPQPESISTDRATACLYALEEWNIP